MFVCHKCDTPACVNPDHLFLGTPQANNDDMRVKGRARYPGARNPRRGERHHKALLTGEQVKEIRASSDLQCVLAERYGVSKQTISAVVRKEVWTDVD